MSDARRRIAADVARALRSPDRSLTIKWNVYPYLWECFHWLDVHYMPDEINIPYFITPLVRPAENVLRLMTTTERRTLCTGAYVEQLAVMNRYPDGNKARRLLHGYYEGWSRENWNGGDLL